LGVACYARYQLRSWDVSTSVIGVRAGAEVDASPRLDLTSSTPYSIASSITSGIMTKTEDKVLENKLRRIAARRGLRLEKSRRRDPNALGYGGYMLVDAYNNTVVAGATNHEYDCTLADIEKELSLPSVKAKFPEGRR